MRRMEKKRVYQGNAWPELSSEILVALCRWGPTSNRSFVGSTSSPLLSPGVFEVLMVASRRSLLHLPFPITVALCKLMRPIRASLITTTATVQKRPFAQD
jgi:hypothetical protein